MGRQIILQPDGRFCLFSSVSDGFLLRDVTREQLTEWIVDEAMRDLRERIQHKIDAVASGHPERAYYQFAMTWEEACRMHNANFPRDEADRG